MYVTTGKEIGMRTMWICAVGLVLAACGLADVGTATATSAKLKAEQVKQGQALTDKVKQDLDAAAKAQAARLEEAEKK